MVEGRYARLREVHLCFRMEYTASDLRALMKDLFPHRSLVLSQFTLFCRSGVSSATGSSFKRGRRCFRLEDLLPMAAVVALKEEGVSLSAVPSLPSLVRENAPDIFEFGAGCRLFFCSGLLSLFMPGLSAPGSSVAAFRNACGSALESFLDGSAGPVFCWGFDIGLLAERLLEVAGGRCAEKSLRVA